MQPALPVSRVRPRANGSTGSRRNGPDALRDAGSRPLHTRPRVGRDVVKRIAKARLRFRRGPRCPGWHSACPDEKADTTVAFTRRALEFFEGAGTPVSRSGGSSQTFNLSAASHRTFSADEVRLWRHRPPSASLTSDRSGAHGSLPVDCGADGATEETMRPCWELGDPLRTRERDPS